MLEKLLRELIEKRAVMALDVLDSPPADWPGFQERLGRYRELKALIDALKDAMSGMEKDE